MLGTSARSKSSRRIAPRFSALPVTPAEVSQFCAAAHEAFFVDDVRAWTRSRFGIALPKDVFDSLRQQKLIVFTRMTDPPPELVGSPGQWVVEPAAVQQISDHGFFFKIQ